MIALLQLAQMVSTLPSGVLDLSTALPGSPNFFLVSDSMAEVIVSSFLSRRGLLLEAH